MPSLVNKGLQMLCHSVVLWLHKDQFFIYFWVSLDCEVDSVLLLYCYYFVRISVSIKCSHLLFIRNYHLNIFSISIMICRIWIELLLAYFFSFRCVLSKSWSYRTMVDGSSVFSYLSGLAYSWFSWWENVLTSTIASTYHRSVASLNGH